MLYSLEKSYIRYKERGLGMADSLTKVVKQYERDNDIVLQFLETHCEQGEDFSIRAKDIYSKFKVWAKSEGAYVLSARKFNAEMERHPEWYDSKIMSGGYAVYKGVKLRETI